jgi:hypothetical protein
MNPGDAPAALRASVSEKLARSCSRRRSSGQAWSDRCGKFDNGWNFPYAGSPPCLKKLFVFPYKRYDVDPTGPTLRPGECGAELWQWPKFDYRAALVAFAAHGYIVCIP